MFIRRRKWPCPKESVLLRKTHAMSYLCPPIPTTSLLRIIYVYIIGFFVYFNTKMSTSCLFRGWNILSIKCDKNSWNIIAHVYSPVKEVVVIDVQYTFRKWLFLEHISILQVKEPFSNSGETSFIVFLPNDHLII